MNIISTSLAGMTAASQSIAVTKNNIANATVPGYSRQQAVYDNSPGGQVYVRDIERISNSFYVAQQQAAGTELGYATAYASQASQLESAVSGEALSLSPALNGFFNALKSAQSEPMAPAWRQQVLSSSENLAARYNSLADNLSRQLDNVNTQMAEMTDEANGLIDQVTRLNGNIMKAGAKGDVPPNLLDQRDQAVQKLSGLVGMEAVYQDDQTVNLMLPNGEPLVTGNKSSQLVLSDGNPNPLVKEISVDNGIQSKPVAAIGGALQGQLDFRDEMLLPAQKELHDWGQTLTTQVNAILSKGYDPKGNAGQPLFDFSAEGQLKVALDKPEQLAFSASELKPGNNDNLLALSGLQEQKTLNGMTLNDSWNNLVITVASQTSTAENRNEAAKALYNTAENKATSVSGVNLDEEAASLMVFQQAYSANAKVIATAKDMFNTILSI